MRERAQAIGLMDAPDEEWDAPVRVHTETLGQALGMDWAKYAHDHTSPTHTEALSPWVVEPLRSRYGAMVLAGSSPANLPPSLSVSLRRSHPACTVLHSPSHTPCTFLLDCRYAASMAIDGPTTEHRLKLKIHRVDQLAREAGDTAREEGRSTARSSDDEGSSARGTARSNVSRRSTSTSSSVMRGGSTARSDRSGDTSARKGGGGTAKAASAPRRKVVYTRDGRMIDNTMRSAEEAALLERVQGHSTLAPPDAAHPSIAKYVKHDGTSLLEKGNTTIEAKPLATTPMIPKWQLEKQLEKHVREMYKKQHIDYGVLAPKQKTWMPKYGLPSYTTSIYTPW